jgi:hypothetical protein
MQQLLKKIIRSGIGPLRFWMAAIGMGVAVLFILLAVQTWANFNELLHGRKNENETADFLVINKVITADKQGNRQANSFSAAEIGALRQESFVEKVGVLTSTNYYVGVSSYTDAFPFYTDAYFESVPDEFIDVKSTEWKWQEGDKNLPVIIPTFFLDLYNSGMAMSQEGLPQLSLEALKAIPLKITVRGNGRQEEFVGHVAGTSDRLNSILIPEAFMQYSNQRFGYQQQQNPARIVIKTNDPSNPELVKYLEEKGWRTNTDKTRFSRVRQIVTWIVGIVGGIGLVMLMFGLLVFSLFIQLTIASCKEDIALLQTLGTSPRQLQGFLMKEFLPVNGVILLSVIVFLSAVQWGMQRVLATQGMYVNPWLSWVTLLAMLLLIAMIWITNRSTIRHYLKQ